MYAKITEIMATKRYMSEISDCNACPNVRNSE